jgi:hypothetical protein
MSDFDHSKKSQRLLQRLEAFDRNQGPWQGIFKGTVPDKSDRIV